jgi:hypothetical protein
MSNRIIIACILWISILAATVMAGCSQEQPAAQGQAELRGGDILHDGFRIRRDAVRNRIWLLGLDNVRIYDGQSKQLIRTIALPGWSVARFACDPDMVLDGSGGDRTKHAVPSGGSMRRFTVSEHPITLEEGSAGMSGRCTRAQRGGTLLADDGIEPCEH